MLSMMTWTSASDAAAYYSKQTELEYYAGGKEGVGEWRGAESLGFRTGDPVTEEGLSLLLRGFDSAGNAMVKNAGDAHRPGYDLTFSAPKSVSVLWALGSEEIKEAVLSAHQKAVDAALSHIKDHALMARRGAGGIRVEAVQDLVAAKFDHAVSREHDPQLHTHALLFNLAPRKDQTWGAIESKFIFREKMAAGAVYRAELAYNLKRNLGVRVERHGREFEIEGVPPSLTKALSTRREQIKAALQERGHESARAAAVAALDTRKPKEEKALALLRDDWLKLGRGHGFDEAKVIRQEQAYERTLDSEREIKEAFSELTAHQSTFTAKDLRQIFATRAQGFTGRDGIEAIYQEAKSHHQLIALGLDSSGFERFTTEDVYKLEKSMFDRAISRAKEQGFRVSPVAVAKGLESYSSLRDEQVNMVKAITMEPGTVKIALGGAGSGKSYALSAARDIWQAEGYRVTGMAPTGKAAQGLEDSAKIKSQTVDSFLLAVESDKVKLLSRDILVVDEAGMMGSKKMNALLEAAHEAKAKVVLVGDHRQLQPIEAGSATRMLRQGVGASELKEMKRQEKIWQQEATRFFAEGSATEALNAYAKHDQLKVFQHSGETRKALVKDYVNDLIREPLKSRLVIAETNGQVSKLNDEIRSELKEHGILPKIAHTINVKTRDDDLVKREFTEGDRVYFTRNNRKLGVSNGTFGRLQSIGKADYGYDLAVKTDNGRLVRFNTKNYKHLEYGYSVTVHKSQGDTVDRSYFLVSDQTSREAAYVAASRHRENMTLYIDRTSFSQGIDWGAVKLAKTFEQKVAEIEKASIAEVAKQMERPRMKDTSLDYGYEPKKDLSTKALVELAKKLEGSLSQEEKVQTLFEIGTSFRGAEHRFKTPPLELAGYQKKALDLVGRGQFDKEQLSSVAKEILKLPEGQSVEPSKKMREFQVATKEHHQPTLEKSLKVAKAIDQKQEMSQGRGFGRGR